MLLWASRGPCPFCALVLVLKHHASGRHPHDSLHLDHHAHEDHAHLDQGSHSVAEKHDDDVKPALSGAEILDKAMKRALGGGLTGAAAMC